MSGAAKEPERFIVQEAVAREHGARVDVGLALEVGEAAARLLEGDEHGPDGNVADEVLGPVDGIDDPAIGRRALLAELLTEEASARGGRGEDAAYHLLRLPVGLGHRRLIRLDGDLEAAAI